MNATIHQGRKGSPTDPLMMNPLRSCLFVVFAAWCGSLIGQTADQYDRVLLPLTARGAIPGNFGSQWITDMALTNMSDSPVNVLGFGNCGGILCNSLPPVPARTTVVSAASPGAQSCGGQGSFLAIERGRSRDIAVTLRSRDLSRQSETWGTTVPVIAFDQLFGRKFGMVDIPVDPQFRTTLRLYDVNGATPPAVRLRIDEIDPALRNEAHDFGGDKLLLEMTPSFLIPTTGGGVATCPAYSEISLSSLPALADAKRIRVEIEPLDGVAEYWGMVSVTHNATQHVTVILPR